jgi:hypothetical protein
MIRIQPNPLVVFVFILGLLVNFDAIGFDTKSKSSVADPHEALSASLASVKGVVASCNQQLEAGLIVSRLQRSYAITRQEKDDAAQASVRVYDEVDKCKDRGLEKIKEATTVIVPELSKRQIRQLGVDYMVQAQTTLQAIGRPSLSAALYSAEFSKLNSIQNRIEVELSVVAGPSK